MFYWLIPIIVAFSFRWLLSKMFLGFSVRFCPKIKRCVDISLTNIFCFHSAFLPFNLLTQSVLTFTCFHVLIAFVTSEFTALKWDCIFLCGIYLLAVWILSSLGRRKSLLQRGRGRESGWARKRERERESAIRPHHRGLNLDCGKIPIPISLWFL